MKLWKSKKSTSCVPGKFASSKNEDKLTSSTSTSTSPSTTPSTTTISGDRAMSPAQSEDSGLAADRGTTYATISLPRENSASMGIVFVERADLSFPPVIASINAYGPASDFLAPGDRLHQIDGISTVGLTNNHVLSILLQNDGPAVIEIEYCLPDYISQNSLCVTSKLAQITVERENSCFGLTLRGGGEYPLIVTNVRPHGPVFKTGRIKPGDRLLRVDNISLINKTLLEAQQILKCGNISGYTNLTIEYDVSVMQSVEFSMGPLLIEIERPMNDKLGLILSSYSSFQHINHNNIDDVSPAGVFVASILAASIADRCGALSVGDQILSIDETVIENTALSPDDVMAILDANTSKGYTQIQIMPSHAFVRRGITNGNFNTMESRKTMKHRKFIRKSSLPLESGTLHSSIGLCRSETITVVLDCHQGSGLIVGAKAPCGRGQIITQIIPDSVADRSGCIQKGDRILSINKLYNLDVSVIRQILGDVGSKNPTYHGQHWVELEIEFDMSDSVIPASGVFNVKLAKVHTNGLGITVNGTNHGTFVISEVKPGSTAHRTGSLRAGDILLAVDSHTLQHFNVDSLLKDNKNDFTTLTIKRNSLPDFLFDAQQRCNTIYGNTTARNGIDSGYGLKSDYINARQCEIGSVFKAQSCQPEFYQFDDKRQMIQLRRPFGNEGSEPPCIGRTGGNDHTQSLTTEVTDDQYNDHQYDDDYGQHQRFTSYDSNMPPPMEKQVYGTHQLVTNVRLEPNGGPLGITLAGSEDMQKPILISGIIENGVAFNTKKLNIGDRLLAINDESVQDVPLSHATKLLQNIGNVVDLKISRNINENDTLNDCTDSLPQPQAVYAKVQRRPRSPTVFNDSVSSSSKDGKHRSFHVTLYKDTVYDDYGFSVSDGLYERGVYINRIRSGGPADVVGLLRPYDRIMQVNGIKTQDFDCCLTVPLIASAGDKIDMVLERKNGE